MVNVTRKQQTTKMSSQKLSKMPKWLYKGRISLLPKVNMFGKLVCLKIGFHKIYEMHEIQ